MTNGTFWAIAVALTVMLGVVLFTTEFTALGNGILFGSYGLAIGLSYKFLHAKARPPSTNG